MREREIFIILILHWHIDSSSHYHIGGVGKWARVGWGGGARTVEGRDYHNPIFGLTWVGRERERERERTKIQNT